MNNGICSINTPIPYQTDYLSNYSSNNLVRYRQTDSIVPQPLLGNFSVVPSIYELPINTNSRLDLENNLIYIVDTSIDPVAQTPASTAPYSVRSTLVQVPTTGSATSLNIDWGDGSVETYRTNPGIASHRYNTHGIYYVQISFPAPLAVNDYYAPVNHPFLNGRDGKIIGLLSFGNKISSLTLQFFRNIFLVPKILPKNITSLTIFQMGGVLGANISNWDISNLTTRLLIGTSLFNEDVSKWVFNNTITDYSSLFSSCASFNNGDSYTPSYSSVVPIPPYPAGNRLNAWNTSNITNMSLMFFDCFYFNQNLNNWNVSKVTNFSGMFSHTHNTFYSFDGDLSNWQLVASGVNCANMFAPGGTNRGQLFTGKGLDTWNTSGVVNMNNMLTGNNLFNQNLSSWDTSKVTNMAGLFNGCSSFAGSGLNLWNTTSVTGSLASTFNRCSNLNVDLGGWNTTNITNMNSMFATASSFIGSGLYNWNVSKVTDFSNMFTSNYNVYHNFDGDLSNWQLIASGVNCSNMFAGFSTFDPSRAFTGKGLDTWNTSGVTNMSNMFYKNTLFNTNIGSWNTSNVTNMSTMFSSASSFNQPLNSWNVSNVTNMNSTFFGASSFNQPLNNWNVRKVTDFSSMFTNAVSFNGSLNGWAPGADTAGANCSNMFANCDNFIGSGLETWNVAKVTNMSNMFNAVFSRIANNSAFQTNISSWNLAGLNANGSLDGFMGNKTGAFAYSTSNYDALLIGWNNNKLVDANGVANWRTDLRPNFGGAKYTAGGAAAAARAALVSYGWTITDGGTV